MAHMFGRHIDDVVATDDSCPQGTSGDDGERTVSTNRCDRSFEIVELVQRQKFVFVAEQNVHLVLDESPEIVSMTIDAETVGQTQRDVTSCIVSGPCSMPKCPLGVVSIEEIPLHVENLAGGHQLDIDVVRFHERRHSEIGVHRPLGIGSDDDDAAARRHSIQFATRTEMHSHCQHVVAEDVSEIIVSDLANVGGAPSETRNSAHRIRR